eukprot:GFUD01006173.1.p1 GENE.GFUD01006173.1~~GFUD01006173.1.p1  ORF type:complete len:1637 (+),score=606.37 GFUD01006173.1:190-5100(+)
MLLLGPLLDRQQLSCLESSFGLLWWRDRLQALELRLAALDRMIAAESGSRGAIEVGQHLGNLMKDLKAAIQEKESQCQTFRELLLEKENEVQELSKMIVEREGCDKVNDDMKNKLMDVLSAAGKSINGDPDFGDLLKIVTELVSCDENGVVEKGDIATVEDEVKKLGDENMVLSRECKLMNEKLTESENKLMQLEVKNNQCLECAKSCVVVNNLEKEIVLVKQSNDELKESNASQKALIQALKASKDESQELLNENYEMKICLSDITDEKNSLLEQLEQTKASFSEKETVAAELQVTVSQLEKERDLKDQDFVNKLSAEVEKSKALEVLNKEALNTSKVEIQKLSKLNSDLLQSVAENKTLKEQVQNLEINCKKLREEGNEESTVINQLQGELVDSKDKLAELLEQVKICEQDKAAIVSELRNKETKFEEETNNFQKKIEVKDASCKELNEKNLLTRKELDASKKLNANLVEELDNLKISLDAEAQKNLSTLAGIEESHDREITVIKQEMSDIRTDIMTQMAETHKSEMAVLKVTEQELLAKLDTAMSSNHNLQSQLVEGKQLSSVLLEKNNLQTKQESSENQNLKMKIELCEKSYQDLKNQLDASENSKEELQSQFECLISSNKDLQTKLDVSLESVITSTMDLQSRLDNAQKVNQELKLKLDDSSTNNQGQLQDLQNRLDFAQKNSQELQLKLDFALANNQEQLDALQNKLNSSESQMEIMNEMEEKLADAETRNAFIQEEQQMFKDKYSEVQGELNGTRQEIEDLQRRITELLHENNISKISKDELQNKLLTLAARAEEVEVENRDIKLGNSNLNENYLQVKENCKMLNEKLGENGKHIEKFKAKEADFTEAINSLKSINEMITKAARDSESGRKELEISCRTVTLEKNAMEASITDFENKNLELISQFQLVSSQKKELEYCYVESQNNIVVLKEENKQLALAKESRVAEEKDVDETEQSAIDKNMIHVLNEKIRENTQIKSENNYLIQNITVERDAKEKLEAELAESKQTYSSMNTETVKKLSMLIRDKDLEIESLSERNKTLLEIIENEKGIEKKDNDKEAELLEEIRKLKDENIKDKESVDNSNELLYLKGRIEELERKLNSVGRDKVEDNRVNTINQDFSNNQQEEAEVGDRSLTLRLETKSLQLVSVEKQAGLLGQELAEVRSILSSKEEELVKLKEEMNRSKGVEGELQQEVERVRRSLVSMQGMLEEKTTSNVSQQEQGMKYIGECERLSKEMSQMTSERDTAVTQGKARLQEAQDLRREVSSIIEKKKRVEGEVERLRGHLVQVEEGYTVELMEGEDRERELRKRVALLEDQLRVATHTSSEVSESASQASTQLTAALETAATQRDSLSDRLASCQATLRTRNMELRNLQLALEGFQKQKENELGLAEKNCEEKVAREQRVVGDLQEKLRVNKQQLDRAQQGLEAAARLSEQLDKKSTVVTNLKQEISVREEMVKNMQEKLLVLSSGQVGRVDRDLVKNLVVGYVTADDSKKPEVLRIIATVLDFNSEERGRTGLEGGVGGWLGGLLGSRSRHPSISQAPVEQSIAKAFIQFLEDESTPRNIVTLPVLEMAKSKAEQLAGRAGKTPSPLLSASPTLSLPSLGSHNSHSPSILKSVLDEPEKENSS